MEIHINPTKKLSEIQSEFSSLFPFLKIEFFSKQHDVQAPSAFSQRLSPALTLKEAAQFDGEAELRVTSRTLAGAFEAEMQKCFGIGVQVFRRSGRAWILTTLTDDWTLAHQNEEGRKDTELLQAD
jgi:hypothetical protein